MTARQTSSIDKKQIIVQPNADKQLGPGAKQSLSDKTSMRRVSSVEGLFDKQTEENKKKFLYDKQLKAYYDPQTKEYFELKAQAIQTPMVQEPTP